MRGKERVLRFSRQKVSKWATLRALATSGLMCGLLSAGGCILDVPSFIDPGETAGLRDQGGSKEPLVVQILDELDPVLEEGNREYANAEVPRPEDLVIEPADYVVGPGDLLQVTVFDLEGVGLQTVKQTRVSGTGNVALPYLNKTVRAEGLTEIDLQQAIAQSYKEAGVLDQANVSVSVVEARNRAFSVLGSVARPGTYVITDEQFRLLDAITQAGDIVSPYLEDVYIFRRTDDMKKGATTNHGAATVPAAKEPAAPGATQPADDLAPPKPQSNSRVQPKSLKKSVMLQAQGNDPLAPDAGAARPAAADVVAEDTDESARVGRIDGQDVVVQPAEKPAADVTLPSDPNAPFEFGDLPPSSDVRVIRIPLARLRAGEFQYNIAIRPRDTVYVPPGQTGFYYMEGHVARAGAYGFNGQKITLKQAVWSASGLDGLSIPQRTDIVRRIGPNREMYYRVDLAAVFAGKRPDIYLKSNDQVLVGTNFIAPFLAAVRSGFRMTYGAGFLYDRNFAYSTNDQNR
jgi:protein involved in polysaccharide export with SLBB domain